MDITKDVEIYLNEMICVRPMKKNHQIFIRIATTTEFKMKN